MELSSDVPSGLAHGPVRLHFDKVVHPDWHADLVPFYHFEIHTDSAPAVGHINLRLGDNRHILMCAGHIGFAIAEAHRGKRYSFHACQALAPFVVQHFESVIITADPDNTPSNRIIDRLGAVFLDEIIVPRDDPSYIGGARRKRRYAWTPERPT